MLNRRGLLKVVAGAAGAAVAAPIAGDAEARGNAAMPEEALGLLYDGTLCIGCKACITACRQSNGTKPARTKLAEGDYWDAPLDISGDTLNIIKAYRSGTGERKDQIENGYAFTKQSCMHCSDPSCVSACPASAMTKDPVTGIVQYNLDACIGCRYCVAACPFGVPRFTYDRAMPKISKCELCRHRISEGKYAACAEVCPTGATLYGKVKDLKAEIARRKALRPGVTTEFSRGRIGGGDTYVGKIGAYVDRVYGEKEIGGTQVLHLSGVPFELLDKPPLPEIAPASVAETLQHTIYRGLVAPVLVLAGLGALTYRNMRPHEPEPSTGGGER